MKISGVDFPLELLRFLEDGELVVFAGAGVSMGPPACFPNFSALADEVAGGTGEARGRDEPEDQFLGRLKDKGVLVHRKAAQALSGDTVESPTPTRLHFAILRLFTKPGTLRVVTTNFDLLFERAARGVLETYPPSFSAPAIPLGTQFEGIVHVHGDINRPENMVLTDADFGRAYLAVRWAPQFLTALFNTFPVLFIGYSHNDVVMKYLARALTPSGKKRYVLAASDEDEHTRNHWEVLGIQRIEYPNSPDDNHQRLSDAVSGLANLARRNSIEWKRRITEIVCKPPSGDEEQMDLIVFALQDAELTKHFTSADTPSDWIRWIAERDDIDGLFDAEGKNNLSERDDMLARWLAEKFAREHADQLFRLIGLHGTRLHPIFWWHLAWTIGRRTDIPIESETFHRWVSLLLSTTPTLSEEHYFLWSAWSDLGKRCIEAGLTDSCIDIFELMAGSRLEFDRHADQVTSDYRDRRIRADFKPVCDFYTIDDFWTETLMQSLDDIADPLFARIVEILERRHRKLNVWQAANRSCDPHLIHRDAISPEEDDYDRKPVDVVIDAGRDCLVHLIEHRPRSAASWCERLRTTGSPFLRKLAVHGLDARKDITETEKIDWLLNHHDIHDNSTEAETRQLLLSAYPAATLQQRKAVIEAVLAYSSPIEDDEYREKRTANVHRGWFKQLHRVNPNCALTKQNLDKILCEYPDFSQGEMPEPAGLTDSEWFGLQSPWSVEELLARPAGEWANKLQSFQETDSFGPNREGLVETVKSAAEQNIEWGLQLADALSESGSWNSDLWPSLMHAWSGELSLEKIRQVLSFLKSPDLHAQHGQSVVGALSAVVRNENLIRSPKLLSEANQIAKQLEEQLGQIDPEPFLEGWLMRAINSMAGKLAEYWLYSLDAWRKQQTRTPEQLSPEYRSALNEIIGDTTLAGTFGKVVLARGSNYLLHADEEWTKTNLLPLFADADDIQVYQAIWDGLLFGSRSLRLASVLKHSFLNMITRLDALLPGTNLKANFVDYFIYMLECIDSDSTGILDEWIPSFFANVDEEAKILFAHKIQSRLQCMLDEKQREWWHRWLKRYLENRSLGVPAPLSQGEVGAILGWLPHFKSLFPDAVMQVTKLPPPLVNNGYVMYIINRGTLWEAYPEAVASLLAYLDRCTLPSWIWHNEGKELISKLLESTLADADSRILLELSARRGLNLQKDEL